MFLTKHYNPQYQQETPSNYLIMLEAVDDLSVTITATTITIPLELVSFNYKNHNIN